MRCAGKVIGTYTPKAAAMINRPDLVGHKKRDGCGFNVAPMIAELPEDGAVHKLKCPKCGNVMTVRKIPGEPAADAEPAPEA